MLFVVLFLVFLYRIIGYYRIDRFCENAPYPLISLIDFPFYMLSFHFPALIMYFYKTNKDKELKKHTIYQLEKEKIANELKYLKAQLNPHFLFNTLNNLYSYVITKSPKAPNMVLQLSEILDYILYKSQQEYVSLVEEIHTIENYIAFEEIKYGERLKVSFEKNYTPRSFTSFTEMAHENAYSRVPLGVHVAQDAIEGLQLGYEISNAVNSLDLN